MLKDSGRANLQVTIYVSSKTPIATFRIRRLGDKPWWESDRRWTFDHTSKVFEFARGHAQPLCDEFGLKLLLPDPSMDEPLPGRFRKLDPKGPATIFHGAVFGDVTAVRKRVSVQAATKLSALRSPADA